LNRLPKIGVYKLCEGRYVPLDWKGLDRQIKESAREFRELNVYLGKDKIPCRMVITPVPSTIAEERVRKAKQGGKRKNGYQLSKEYRIKANYNIYITNVPEDVLPARQIIEAYRLRWQIELIFKTWKSNLDIHKIKPVKTPRMECQLLAKLIWILINTKLHHICNMLLSQNQPGGGCSISKFMKYATKFFRSLIGSIYDMSKLLAWFNTVISPVLEDLKVGQRLQKPTHCQILNSISKC
jgi:hypothetical protein